MVDFLDLDAISARIEAAHWVEEIPGLGDLRLKVRGFNSDAYRKAIDRAVWDELNDDEAEVEALATAILVDWGNLTETPGGLVVEYSAATARALLADASMPAFREGVAWAAGRAGAD